MNRVLGFALLLLLAGAPETSAVADRAPASLTSAVRAFAETRAIHDVPTFEHALVDLDGDGRADAVVLLESRGWCGSGGCTMLVFRATDAGFDLVSYSTITNQPIRVSPEVSHGWKSLIVYSKNVGNVLMRFDGSRYPLNPSMQPKATSRQVASSKVAIDGSAGQ